MNKFSKIFVFALLAVAIVAPSASAQTDINAQIQALLAQIQALQAQAGTTPATSATYTSNLTVGSKGAEVTALQGFLNSKGFLSVAPTGFFGPMTKAALAAYQKSVGISPAVGYFGAVTRAHFNSMSVVTTPTTPTIPTTPTTPTTPTGMTKTEGTLTVELSPTPADGQKAYEGATKFALIGLKLKATNGDVNVERVKIDLGSSTALYNKILSTLYVMDGSTVLSSSALNSNTVVKDGTNYYVTVSGLSFLVKAGEYKVLTVAGDLYSTIDTADANAANRTVTVPANGVRGKDGLGIDQYGPASAISRTFNPEKSQVTNATLTVSKNGNSPKAANIVSDTNGDVKEATLLAVDLRSEKDQIKVTDFVVTLGGNASESTVYAYDGSTLLGSATVSSDRATFTSMTLYVPADSTKTITIKADYTGATTTAATSTASLSTSAGFVAENSRGDSVTGGYLSGSALSDTMTVLSKGLVVSLTSASGITTQNTAGANATPTYKGMATFVLSVTAAGGDIYLSDSTSTNLTYATSIGGAATGSSTVNNSLVVTGYNSYAGGVYKISKDTTASITVKGEIPSTVVSGSYMMFVKNIIWSTDSALASPVTTSLDSSVYKTTGAGVTLP